MQMNYSKTPEFNTNQIENARNNPPKEFRIYKFLVIFHFGPTELELRASFVLKSIGFNSLFG